MEAVNPNDNALAAGNARTSKERIATLEERSQHAATKAELHRAMLMLFVALFTTLGGLVIHLHNTTLNEIAEIRRILIDILQQLYRIIAIHSPRRDTCQGMSRRSASKTTR